MKKLLGILGIGLVLLGLSLPASDVAQAAPKWREFANTEELAKWLDHQPIDLPLLPGGTDLSKQNYCVYTALRLQERALNDGFLVGYTLPTATHMGNIAVMGNDIWYFEKLFIRGGYIIKHAGYVGPQAWQEQE